MGFLSSSEVTHVRLAGAAAIIVDVTVQLTHRAAAKAVA